VAVLLSSVRPVRLRAPAELVEVIEQHREGLPPVPGTADGSDEKSQVVLVDTGTMQEIIDPRATKVSVVAIAPRGISRTRLRALADDYRDAGLVGVVLAEAGSAVRSKPARPIRFAAPTATVRMPATLAEPERA